MDDGTQQSQMHKMIHVPNTDNWNKGPDPNTWDKGLIVVFELEENSYMGKKTSDLPRCIIQQ